MFGHEEKTNTLPASVRSPRTGAFFTRIGHMSFSLSKMK
jgi:hypothetical protein